MTVFKYNVGEIVRVHFPDEPHVVFAGQTVTATIESVRHSEYPYAVTWTHEGRELRRLCASDWLQPLPKFPKGSSRNLSDQIPLGF